MPKQPKSPGASQRHNPLAEEYAPSEWKTKPAKRQKRNRDDKDGEQGYVDSKSSRKILDIGEELREEDERESRAQQPEVANPAFNFRDRIGEEEVEGFLEDGGVPVDDDDEAWGDDDEEVEEVEIDANDLAAWNKFIPTDDNPIVWPGEEAQAQGQGTDLAALILEKIAAHEASDGAVKQPEIMGGGAPEDAIELPAKVVEGIAYSISSYPLGFVLICKQSTAKSASSSRATSPANSPSPSKSSPQYQPGRPFSPSRGPKTGPRTPCTPPHESSSPRNRTLHKYSSTPSSSPQYKRTSKKPPNSTSTYSTPSRKPSTSPAPTSKALYFPCSLTAHAPSVKPPSSHPSCAWSAYPSCTPPPLSSACVKSPPSK